MELSEKERAKIRDDVAYMRMQRDLLKQIHDLRREVDDIYETLRLIVERDE